MTTRTSATASDTADHPVLLVDTEGTIQGVNSAFETLLDRPRSSLVQQPLACVFQTEPGGDLYATVPCSAAWVLAAAQENMPRVQRLHVLDVHNHPRVLDVYVLPLSDLLAQADEPLQLADSRHYLLVHMVDATSQLQTLAQMMEREHMLVGRELVAMVAHQVNTPLQSLRLWIDMLMLSQEPEEQMELEQAQEEIERISTILDHLKDAYRSSSSSSTLIDVNTLLTQTLALVSSKLATRRIYVTTEFARDLPPLHGSNEELIEMLLHILMNAVDAMPDGGMLTISTAPGNTNGPLPAHSSSTAPPPHHTTHLLPQHVHTPDSARRVKLTIVISDTGGGIDPALHEYLFNPFFTTRMRRTGLGLSMARRIALQHGGDLVLESQPGLGTSVSIQFLWLEE